MSDERRVPRPPLLRPAFVKAALILAALILGSGGAAAVVRAVDGAEPAHSCGGA